MEGVNAEEQKIEKSNLQGVGVSYPVEPIDSMLDYSKTLVDEYGSSRPITKDEISKTLNKKVASLSLFFSTMVQYGLFTLIHSKGYLPSDLYRKYTEPVHDNDEYKYKLLMFKNAPLYAKLIDNINGHTLPADEKRVANLLKGEPYNVNPNSSDKAARVFIENCRNLNLRDSGGKFKFPDLQNLSKEPQGNSATDPLTPYPPANTNHQQNPPTPPAYDDSLFELPIPLPNKRKAYLRYPLDNLTRKDITVITKALEFIASSLEDEETKKE